MPRDGLAYRELSSRRELMSTPTKPAATAHRWSDLSQEQVKPDLARRLITGASVAQLEHRGIGVFDDGLADAREHCVDVEASLPCHYARSHGHRC